MNVPRLVFIVFACFVVLLTTHLYVERVLNAPTPVENVEALKEAAINAASTNLPNALLIFKRYLQRKPDDADAHRRYGNVLSELGRNEEALVSYQRAVELDPSSSKNWLALSWKQILAGAFVVARTSCEKGVALDPTGFATLNLGHTYLLQGDPKTAQEWYQKTLVNIESDEGLKDGPLADFDIFIAKNWQVKESVQAKTWFAKEGALWLERSAPVRKLLTAANEAEEKKNFTQAIMLLEKRLPLLIALVGENHLRIAISLDKLAELYKTQYQYAQAEPLYKRSLAIKEKVIGRENLEVATTLDKLAGLYEGLKGQHEETVPLYKRSLAIKEKVIGPDSFEVASTLDKLAWVYEDQRQYAQAAQVLKRTLAIRERKTGSDDEDDIAMRKWDRLAELYIKLGQFPQAEPILKRSLAIKEKSLSSDPSEVIIALNALGALYIELGQFSQAEPLFRRYHELDKKFLAPDSFDVANSLSSQANVANSLSDQVDVAISLSKEAVGYYYTGQYAQAEQLFKQSLTILEKAHGLVHPDVAACLNNLASMCALQGQYAQAEQLYKRALSITEKDDPDSPDIVSGLEKVASLYDIQGKYAQSEILHKRAMSITEKITEKDDPEYLLQLADILNNRAVLYHNQGLYVQAEQLYKRALAIKEKVLGPKNLDLAEILNNLAELYQAQGHYDQAEPLLKRALAIREEIPPPGALPHYVEWSPDSLGLAAVLNNLGKLYYDQGQYEQADSHYKRSLVIIERMFGPDYPYVANNFINLAKLYQAQGHYDKAEPLLKRAFIIGGNAGAPMLALKVQVNLRSFYSKSKPELAIWYGKQAVNTLQTVRASNAALDKNLQKSFLEKNEDTYKELADLLFTQGRMMEGQQVLAMLKESEYFDFIQRSATDDPRKTTSSNTNREKPWSERYAAISSQLTALSKEYQALNKRDEASLTAAEKTRKAKLDADLTFDRQAYDDFMVELDREFSQTAKEDRQRQKEYYGKHLDELGAQQGTLGDLGHGAVTLHYLMTDKRLWILLTTPTVQLKREAAISEADLNRQIGQYRDAIAQRDPKVKEQGKALYDLIIGPVSEDLKQADAQTLMLSLDGAMRYLPMAALYDGEKFLVERYRLAIYTEAAKTELKDKPLSQWKFAGFGLTDKIDGYDELKSVKEELEGIAADAMDGDIKFNKDFTATSFKSAIAKSPPVVHLSSHFVFKEGTEEDSFLLLGDGNKLSLKQIRDGGYKFTNVDLVTLSACETAVGGGKDENGREVEGFGALAQKQGAKGVLATLWPVNDHSTGQFMQLFYGFRQKNPGMTKAEAMQKAQLAFIKGQVGPALAEVSRGKVIPTGSGKTVAVVTTTDHPYYWAPFILMGNWL